MNEYLFIYINNFNIKFIYINNFNIKFIYINNFNIKEIQKICKINIKTITLHINNQLINKKKKKKKA